MRTIEIDHCVVGELKQPGLELFGRPQTAHSVVGFNQDLLQ